MAPGRSVSTKPRTRVNPTLANGAACLPCRLRKKKCDGLLPRCTRCLRDDLPCQSQEVAPRRKTTDILQERLIQLEKQVARFAKDHDRDLLTQSLRHKLRGLSMPASSSSRRLAIWPYDASVFQLPLPKPPIDIYDTSGDMETGYQSAISRQQVQEMIASTQLRLDGSPLPEAFSLWLIRLFLPYNLQFQFFYPPPLFFSALSRPASDPRAVHPCLLNAIYLAACWIVGGELNALKPYFLEQTRLHMAASLESVDRLTDFLWANVVFASYLAIEGRMVEAYATISSAADFALACGLDIVTYRRTSPAFLNSQRAILLPEVDPDDFDEMNNRMRLSRGIYITSRTLAMVGGWPSISATPPKRVLEQICPAEEARIQEMGKRSKLSKDDMDRSVAARATTQLGELLEEDQPLCLKVIILYEGVETLAREAISLPDPALTDLVSTYSNSLSAHAVFLPTLTDAWCLDPYDVIGARPSHVNPVMFFSAMNFYGSVMLLNSITAGKDARARWRVVQAANDVVEMVKRITDRTDGEGWASVNGVAQRVRRVHGSLPMLLHMRNAIHVFASYIRTAEAKQDDKLFATCCQSLETLLDLLRDALGIYNEWGHVLPSLKDLFPEAPSVSPSSTPEKASPPTQRTVSPYASSTEAH